MPPTDSAITTAPRAVSEAELALVVTHRAAPVDDIVVLELADPGGAELPEWTPGAHIELVLDDDLARQYSLCGSPSNGSTWRVAVLLERDGRGGSRRVHDELHVGSTVRTRGPRNHFRLADAPHYVFIAGGIGITPLIPMIEAVDARGATWQLVYGGRHRGSMAFADDLAARWPSVRLHPEDECGLLPIDEVLRDVGDNTLVYSCGPERLLSAVEDACAGLTPGTLHVERFAPRASGENAGTRAPTAITVECRRSGVTVTVGPDQSILEVVQEAGVAIYGSCLEGTCGTCEAVVIAGSLDHRDSVLNAAEREVGDVMFLCVSRAHVSPLILDI